MKTFLKWCEEKKLDLPLVVDAGPGDKAPKKDETRSTERSARSGQYTSIFADAYPEAHWNTKDQGDRRKGKGKTGTRVVGLDKLPPA